MRAATAAAAVATTALIGALVAVPLESLARVAADGGLTGIARALSAPASRVAILHTVAVAGAVTVLAVTAGTALALAVERRPARSRLLPRMLVAGPLVIPEFVLGFAWSQAYGPAGLSDRVGGLTMPGLFGPAGIIAVLTVYGLPLAYLAVTAGSRRAPIRRWNGRPARRARAAGLRCAPSRCRCCASRCSARPRWSSSRRRAASPCPRCSARRPASAPCRR